MNKINNPSRGFRNKNPFNLRRSKNSWLGKVSFTMSSDKEFEQFIDMDYGLRAGLILFRNYSRIHKLKTARQMMYRFAPACENPMENYLWYLELGGVKLDEPLVWRTSEFLNFLSNVIKFESDVEFSPAYLSKIINKFKIY